MILYCRSELRSTEPSYHAINQTKIGPDAGDGWIWVLLLAPPIGTPKDWSLGTFGGVRRQDPPKMTMPSTTDVE